MLINKRKRPPISTAQIIVCDNDDRSIEVPAASNIDDTFVAGKKANNKREVKIITGSWTRKEANKNYEYQEKTPFLTVLNNEIKNSGWIYDVDDFH